LDVSIPSCLVLILSKRDLSTCIFCLITVFLIFSVLEIQVKHRQKSIYVEFSFAAVINIQVKNLIPVANYTYCPYSKHKDQCT
jgi:hypothetical protein